MKKLFFMLLIITSFSPNIFCAHESSKDLEDSAKDKESSEAKFAMNSVEFKALLIFIQNNYKEIIMNGSANIEHEPPTKYDQRHQKMSGLRFFDSNKGSALFEIEKPANFFRTQQVRPFISIKLHGISDNLPPSLRKMPGKSTKELKIKLQKSFDVSFSFSLIDNRFKIQALVQGIPDPKSEITEDPNRLIFIKKADVFFDPMIKQIRKYLDRSVSKMKEFTSLPTDIQNIVVEYMDEPTEAEKKRSKAQQKPSTAPSSTPTPPTASTSALSKDTSSLEDVD